ncbi:MAG: carboxyltransferase domain-containing protein [Candidatus Moduliflexus flocculans]|nr:carboxyltransferase domain-containing protein [Candidatus Moduliflexus flocculans]
MEYGDGIDARTQRAGPARCIARSAPGAHAGIVETVPTYRSLMVHYDPMVLSREAVDARDRRDG